MDVSLLVPHFQYAIPVVFVLVCAVLVFVFGFKNAEQPSFAQLAIVSDVDRKQTNKKRGKPKEKRSTNNVTSEKASPKKASPVKVETAKKSAKSDDIDGKLKERKQENNTQAVTKKDKTVQSGKENKLEHVKNKKNLKNSILEKPIDFDEGDWEQAYSRKDKKKKIQEETPNKTKKSKKDAVIRDGVKEKDQEKGEIKDKVAKETENKELKEKDQQEVVLESDKVVPEPEVVDPEPKEEPKKVKKVEKDEKEEKKSTKSKKAKKSINEADVTHSEKISTAPPDQVVEKKVVDESKKTADVKKSAVEEVSEKATAVFDELGDVWTEAKTQKKSKKKTRKDN